jgi:hypothetical protein
MSILFLIAIPGLFIALLMGVLLQVVRMKIIRICCLEYREQSQIEDKNLLFKNPTSTKQWFANAWGMAGLFDIKMVLPGKVQFDERLKRLTFWYRILFTIMTLVAFGAVGMLLWGLE